MTALAAIVGALPGAIVVVGAGGVVTSAVAGAEPPIDLAGAVGRPLCDVLGLDPSSDDAGRLELWLACGLDQPRALWDLSLGDLPRRLTGTRGALALEVGPLVEADLVTSVVVQVRRAEPSAAAVGGTAGRVDERFAGDAHGILDDCDVELARLARDREGRLAVHRLFRAVHSLKGLAGGAGATGVSALAHRAEDLLAAMRAVPGVDDQALGEVRAVLAELRVALADAVPRGGAADAMTTLYGEARPLVPRLERAVASWSAQPRLRKRADELGRLLRGFHDAARRARCTTLAVRLADLRAEVVHAHQLARPPRSLLAAIERGVDDLASWLRLYHDVHAEVRSHEASAEVASALTACLATVSDPSGARRALAGEARAAGVLSLATALSGDDAELRRGLAAVADLPAMMAAAVAGPRGASAEAARELDAALVALERELADGVLADEVAPSVARLRAAVVALTWTSLDEVAARIATTTTAVAAETGKQVALDLDAHGLRLPGDAQRAIADILIHAVRNAIDHGIEAPDERVALGKPTTGRLVIRVETDDTQARILIQDDGRGVDLERVRRRGAELGLLGPDPDAASAAEVIEVLFHPGFSTTEQVTEISGRGVGMDAIRELARARGGDAELRTVAGRGTVMVVTVGLADPAPVRPVHSITGPMRVVRRRAASVSRPAS